MPIDPRIALQGRVAAPPDLSKGMQLAAALDTEKLRQMLMRQEYDLTQEKYKSDLESAKGDQAWSAKASEVLTLTGGDYDKAYRLLSREDPGKAAHYLGIAAEKKDKIGGFQANALERGEKAQAAMAKDVAAFEPSALSNDEVTQAVDRIAKSRQTGADFSADIQSLEQAARQRGPGVAEAWQQIRQKWVGSGMVKPEAFPEQPDPRYIEFQKNRSLGIMGRLDEAAKKLDVEAKRRGLTYTAQEQDRKEEEHMATLPGKQAQSDKYGTDAKIAGLIAGFMEKDPGSLKPNERATLDAAKSRDAATEEYRRKTLAIKMAQLNKASSGVGTWQPLTDDRGQINGFYNSKTKQVDMDVPEGLRKSGLSAGERKDIANLEVTFEKLTKLRKVADGNKGSIGKIQGNIAGAKRWLGLGGKEVNELFGLSRNLSDSVLRLRSGAQINEREYDRLMQFLPDPTQGEDTFFANLEQFESEMQGVYQSRTGKMPPIEAGASAPRVGSVQDGYRFKGGDPSRRENWEEVR